VVLMITYDLNSAGQKYEDLIKAIKDNSLMWCTFWKSSFLVKTSLTPSAFFEKLEPFLDSNDRLIAIEVKNNYQGLLTEEQWKYIRENIFG